MADLIPYAPFVTVTEEASLVPRLHGDRVTYDRPDSDDDPRDWPDPYHIFLIYLAQNASQKWLARHMYAPVGADYKATAAQLFDLAKVNDQTTPYRVGDNLVGLVWRRPCYLCLVLDSDGAEFINVDVVDEPSFDPIQFYAKKPVLGTNPVSYNEYDPNHSFYNCDVDTVRGRSAFHCINYLKDELGNDLKYPKVRSYGFHIVYKAIWINGEVRPHTIDPDGQNQGPPSLVSQLEYV